MLAKMTKWPAYLLPGVVNNLVSKVVNFSIDKHTI